jgi:hypothetical protein
MWVKGDCGWQADGTTGLPPAPEIARVLRHLRFVPDTVMGAPWRNCLSRDDLGDAARDRGLRTPDDRLCAAKVTPGQAADHFRRTDVPKDVSGGGRTFALSTRS